MFGSIGSTSKSPIHEVAPKANIMNVAGTIFPKHKLFLQLKSDGVAVINVDDPFAKRMVAGCKAHIVSYGVTADADYRGDNIHIGTNGSTFDLIHHGETYTITTNLVAMYNIYNLLGAIAAMCESGVALKEIVPYLSELTQVDGRMEPASYTHLDVYKRQAIT